MAERKNFNKIHFNKISIKPFSIEFLEDVKNILAESFEHPWSEKLILQENTYSKKLVYIYESKIVGFLDSSIIFNEAELLMIAVKKEYQGKGLGSYILENFLNYLKSINVKNVYLEVAHDNSKAIKLYKKFGFEEYAIRKKYYKNDKDAILMKKIIT